MSSFDSDSTITALFRILKACICKLVIFQITNRLFAFFVADGLSWRNCCVPVRSTLHLFGAKISPTCANYALKRRAVDRETTFLGTTFSVRTVFCMDDYFESHPTVEWAKRKAQDLVNMLAKDEFTLTKIVSNVRGTLSTVNQTDKLTNSNVKAIMAEDGPSYVLELKWNSQFLRLSCQPLNQYDHNCTVTQIVVLSVVLAVYDTIGVAAPFSVKTWLLLQEAGDSVVNNGKRISPITLTTSSVSALLS